MRERVADQHFAIARRQGAWGRGVAWVAGQCGVEFGFPAIQPALVVADAAGERGDGRGTAYPLQEQVAGGVVRFFQCRCAYLLHGHRAADVRARDRRVLHDVGCLDQYGGVQSQLAVRSQLQYPGRGVGLERRAHGEPVIGSMLQPRSGIQVHCEHADSGPVSVFDGGEVECDGVVGNRSRRGVSTPSEGSHGGQAVEGLTSGQICSHGRYRSTVIRAAAKSAARRRR